MKFKAAEVKCSYCNEPNLKLKWNGKDEKGKNVFLNLETNEIHKCQRKFLKDGKAKLYVERTEEEIQKEMKRFNEGIDYYNKYYVNNPEFYHKHLTREDFDN